MKKLFIVLFSIMVIGCATPQPGANLPNSQVFNFHSVDEIQAVLISAYLSDDKGWSIKDQTKNSITFTRVNDGMSGMFMQAAVSGSYGALPIIEAQFAFANMTDSIRVFPKVRVINTNGFGRQNVNNVSNPSGAKETLHYIRNKMEPE